MSKHLSEIDICDRHITPALVGAGWEQSTQIRREYGFTDGAIWVRGKLSKRGPRKRADYVLFRDRQPLAVVEAKDASHSVRSGIQQALGYAKTLDIPFAFSSNGSGFLFHDRTGQSGPAEVELSLDQFPSPDDLWQRYRAWKGFTTEAEKIVTQPFYEDESGKEPRYYQRIAIQRVVEAIAQGQKRALLVMATGTGKTYTAFQIIWRLWKANRVNRVLFLADRNILVDQTMTNDFKPFGTVMTKVKNRTAEKSYEVYLALYQAISGTEEDRNIYKQFSRDFFDLVVIDECHRGSAKEESAWREILDWFEPAVHLGLTATPKETNDVSTQTYFREPLYTYSLKDGIADGFLAPYKVVRIDLDKDLQGWRPPKGMLDDSGQEIEDRIYNQKDMDKALVLPARTQLVAQKTIEYLRGTDPYGKTIVFCENIDHAERMRSALINEVARHYPDEGDNLQRFVVQITGDNDEGKRALDDFIHPERRYPVIATTSKLLTTGVDAKTCRLIVLDQRIESMIEFKQTIGRGTRIHEDAGKTWFTIMDFKKATEKFADPDFDGDPVVIFEPKPGEPVVPPDDLEPEAPAGDPDSPDSPTDEPGWPDDLSEDEDFVEGPWDPIGPEGDPRPRPKRYTVSGVRVSVSAERVQYMDPDTGDLITESLVDHTKKTVQERYPTLHDFLNRWSSSDRKQVIIDELANQGVFFDELEEKVGKDFGPFDLICHIAYGQPPLTRRERAENVKKRDIFTKYGPEARAVLDALLAKYADDGVMPEDLAVLRNQPFSGMGTPVEIIKRFGGKDGYLSALHDLQEAMYANLG